MISHDVEFVAEYADRVGLFFEGNIVTSQNTREFFFAGNNFTQLQQTGWQDICFRKL